jgi:putative hemin transport protein
MTPSTTDLTAAWARLQQEQPRLRIRDAAKTLGCSEAELLATRTEGVTRLTGSCQDVLSMVPKLGRVMALTRNEDCVLERKGTYAAPSFNPHVGLVLGPDIDLRLFMTNWRFGFAITDETTQGTRRSLQFFGKDGSAYHKIYLLEDSNTSAYGELVSAFSSTEAPDGLEIEAVASRSRLPKPDDEIDVEGFREAWSKLEDTHDFYGLLGRFGVTRTQALRIADPEMAWRLVGDSHRELLQAAAESELPIMIFVGSPGCIEIHTGPVKTLMEHDGWYNVMDPDLNLHLRETAIDQTWLVRKPSRDGIVTAVECFDAQGELIVQFFGKRKPGQPELESWRDITAGLSRA